MEEHLCEKIAAVGQFDKRHGSGIAIQLDVEDAIGVQHQVDKLAGVVGDELRASIG